MIRAIYHLISLAACAYGARKIIHTEGFARWGCRLMLLLQHPHGSGFLDLNNGTKSVNSVCFDYQQRAAHVYRWDVNGLKTVFVII